MAKSRTTAVGIPIERIARCVYLIRGQKVMLDSDLAQLYGVSTKVLNQAVTRNTERFPEDFCFRLTWDEAHSLRSQIVTLETASRGQHPKYPPRAFTEQGIAIMRTFVRLREMLATNADLSRKVAQHDRQIAILFDHVGNLLAPPKSKKHPIGFIPATDDEED